MFDLFLTFSTIATEYKHNQPFTSSHYSLTESQFEVICEQTLDSLSERFEDLAEESFTGEQYDVNFSVSYT
jgi:hypothetical protein